MLSCPRWFAACLVMLLATSLPVASILGQADEASAEAAVAEAQQDLTSVYGAVSEAETIGVNVSSFIEQLSVAAGFLAEAETLRRTGNFTGAVFLAGLARESLQGLVGDVESHTSVVALERAQALAWAVAFSIVGLFLVVSSGWIGWGYVRAWYVRRILKFKPEVAEDDEPR